MTQFEPKMPVPSRKARDGTAATKPPFIDGFVDAARFLGGQPFASFSTEVSRHQSEGGRDETYFGTMLLL